MLNVILSDIDVTFHITMTYISWSSEFILYLEASFMDECHTWGMMSQCDAMIDLITNVGHSDLYFMVCGIFPYILKTIGLLNV